MTAGYKRMEQKLQSDIDTLIGDVDTRETKIEELNGEIAKLKDNKEEIIGTFDE